jgi:hypothetical protein
MNDIEISVHESLGKEEFSDIQEELGNLELQLSLTEHKTTGPYASLDWIIPTGVILVILKPYFEGFMQKAGEDHYELLKAFFNKLYSKAITPKEEFKIYSAAGFEKEAIFTMHFSVLHHIIKDGKRITLKLMFPKGCSQDYFQKSLTTFMKFQAELEDNELSNKLFEKLVSLDHGGHGQKIFWYNDSKNALEFLDISASARSKSIVPKGTA